LLFIPIETLALASNGGAVALSAADLAKSVVDRVTAIKQ
jgi:hypothetical protein